MTYSEEPPPLLALIFLLSRKPIWLRVHFGCLHFLRTVFTGVFMRKRCTNVNVFVRLTGLQGLLQTYLETQGERAKIAQALARTDSQALR